MMPAGWTEALLWELMADRSTRPCRRVSKSWLSAVVPSRSRRSSGWCLVVLSDVCGHVCHDRGKVEGPSGHR